MKCYFKIPLIFFIFLCTKSAAQIDIPRELATRLQGTTNFYSIRNTVNDYYNQKLQTLVPSDTGQLKLINRQQKFWKRWEWYMESRLGPGNEFVNITETLYQVSVQMKNNSLQRGSNINGSSSGDWYPIGPEEIINNPNRSDGIGRIDRLAFHPTNPNIIYAGSTSGGLWKSSYGGLSNSWEPISDDIAYMGVSGIVVSNNNPDILYILTGDGDSHLLNGFVYNFGYIRPSIGVLKSTDGGMSWHRTGNFPGVPPIYYGYKLVQDPGNDNVLLAATSDGIFRTADAGNSWTKVSSNSHKYFDIEFKPGNSDTIYAGSSDIFYRSVNGGLSFSNSGITFDVPYSETRRLAIGVSNTSPNIVYLLVEGVYWDTVTSDFKYNGLYKSTNSGTNFIIKSNSPNIFSADSLGINPGSMGQYGLALAISYTNSDKLVTGNYICWRSVDGGITMLNSSVYSTDNPGNPRYVHPDIHDLAYNPLSNILYCANDGGIWRSLDDGQTWEKIFGNLQTTQIYHMKGVESDPDRLILGTQDNGIIYKKNSTTSFYATGFGDGFYSAFNPVNPDTFWCTINASLLKSVDNGTTLDHWLSVGGFYPTVTTHIFKPEIFLLGRMNSVWRSINGGNNFIETNGKGYWSLINCPSNGGKFYGVGDSLYSGDSIIKKVYKSTDEGANWTLISGPGSGLPTGSTGPKITSLGVNPVNSIQVWATYGGFVPGLKVYYSANEGGTWVNRSGSLPNIPVNCMAVDNTGAAYVGTDLGVFYWSITLNDWIPFYNDLPQTPVTDLMLYPSLNIIRASTFGRGVWESPTWTSCDVNLTINQPLGGQNFFEASNNISSSSVISTGTGTNIFFRAGNTVTLTPGFEVKEGSFFKGTLGPCGSGIPTQSKIYTDYNIKTTDEIIKSEFVKISDIPGNTENKITITPLSDSNKEIIIYLKEKMFVQLYFIDDTNEILAWLVKENLPPGQYKLQINDDKLKNGKVKLNIHLGQNIQSIDIK